MTTTLIICPRYPLPELTGADMRTMHFVRYFRQLGPVDIAYTTGGSDPSDTCGNFREVIPMRADGEARFRRRFLRGILTGTPPQVLRYHGRSRRTILSQIKSERYDFILVRYLASSGMLLGLSPALRNRVILDYDDIISGSLFDTQLGAKAGFTKRTLLGINRYWLRRYEQRCLDFGATLVCSEQDRAKLGDGQKRPPFVVPNVLQADDVFGSSRDDGFAKDHQLLFVGTLNYGPNTEGLRWFLDAIFPGFRRAYPDARLSVVGRNPPPELRGLCDQRAGVHLYGDVADLRPFYSGARAIVVPLLAGGGTRIKILEAAAARRPVLSTPMGADGLEFSDGRDILIFRNESEFLGGYGHLALRANYESLVRRSHQVVTTRYSTKAFNEGLDRVLESLSPPRSLAQRSV